MIENESRTVIVGDNLNDTEKFNSDVMFPLMTMCLTNDEPIHIIINSSGGRITNGFALYDMVKEYRKHIPIYTHAIGTCQSAATFAFLGPQKSNRFIYPNTQFMIHAPSTGWGSITPDAIKTVYDGNIMIKNQMLEIYLDETKLDMKKLKYTLDHEAQYWFFGSEHAISSGLGVKPDRKIMKRYWQKNKEVEN